MITMAALLFLILAGFIVGWGASFAWDAIAGLVYKDYKPSSAVRRVLITATCDALWLTGFKGSLLAATLTLALWPAIVIPYLLIRYRPHWFTIWSGVKAVLALALAPVILLVFKLDKEAFINLMTALWPHLDIYTPDGRLYLRRWFMTPKGQSYRPRFLHLIMLSDEGRDPHDHPGAFATTILWNGYDEEVYFPGRSGPDLEEWEDLCECGCAEGTGRPGRPIIIKAREGHTLENPEGHTHIVKLIGPTLTWVKGWKKGKKWGFWKLDPNDPTEDVWTESEEYGEKGEERKSWTIDGK